MKQRCSFGISAFGCKDSLISDDWRQMVLDFHNDNRRRVARGDQISDTDKPMPKAKDMNKLVRCLQVLQNQSCECDWPLTPTITGCKNFRFSIGIATSRTMLICITATTALAFQIISQKFLHRE